MYMSYYNENENGVFFLYHQVQKSSGKIRIKHRIVMKKKKHKKLWGEEQFQLDDNSKRKTMIDKW